MIDQSISSNLEYDWTFSFSVRLCQIWGRELTLICCLIHLSLILLYCLNYFFLFASSSFLNQNDGSKMSNCSVLNKVQTTRVLFPKVYKAGICSYFTLEDCVQVAICNPNTAFQAVFMTGFSGNVAVHIPYSASLWRGNTQLYNCWLPLNNNKSLKKITVSLMKVLSKNSWTNIYHWKI